MASVKRPRVLDHLGPYVEHEPVQEFGEIIDACFAELKAALGGDIRKDESPRRHLVTRMLYISETTSVAARLSASWALSLPAMSLIRDRYEQTVRFSWLARQPDNKELAKFIGSYYAKGNKLFRNLTPTQRVEFEKIVTPPSEWTAILTSDQRAYLERWEQLALDAMAAKRDALPSVADTPLDKETLTDLYTPVYRQFSSVTHFDGYGLSMVGLHQAPSGEWVLAPDPAWPAMLCLHDALFTLIQCHEALHVFYEIKQPEPFVKLHARWRDACKRVLS